MQLLSTEEKAKLWDVLWTHPEIGIARTNEKGEWLDANATYCQSLGRTPVELKDVNWDEITDVQDRNYDMQMARLTAAGHYPYYGMSKTYVKKNNGPVAGRICAIRMNENDENVLSGKFKQFIVTFIPVHGSTIMDGETQHRPPSSLQLLDFTRQYGIHIAALTSTFIALLTFGGDIIKWLVRSFQ